MGRRSKADLLDLIDRIAGMYFDQKMTIQQIADVLQGEGYNISRESVRRSVKTTKEIASELKTCMAEAREIINTVRDDTNTDLVEATVARFGGMLYREAAALDELKFDDPLKVIQATQKLAAAQTSLARLRLDYRSGFEAAKNAVLKALKAELERSHPEVLDHLVRIVSGLEGKA